MSRNILQTHKPYEESLQNCTDKGKLILTECKDREFAFLIKNNRLLDIQLLSTSSKIGSIYIGKVKNVVKNLNACFVEIADDELCFLPFNDAKQPFMLNRSFDGRILQGDELLVQVQRDAQKTKQAALTCNVTIQGEHFVFAIGNTKTGVSAKMNTHQKAQIVSTLLEKGFLDSQGCLIQDNPAVSYGCIIRTQAGDLFDEDRETFLELFQKQLNDFQKLLETSRHRTCYSCIQAPNKPYEGILSHYTPNDYEEVVTDLPEAYTSLQGKVNALRLYEDATFPLKKLYSLENKLQEALSETVWLKSGAYLVIEQTECLTTIDVNSGKMIKGIRNEEAIWKINEEAAKEAALQMRLRNLSGIIIIDFINMKDKTAEKNLIALMKQLTACDKVPVNVVDITPLGLMELTRQKNQASFKEQWMRLT